MNEFIQLAVFTYPHEYTVLKLLLEKEDIRFFFQNETVIGVIPFYSNALGGIFLKVHPEDLKEAKKILEDYNFENHLHIV
ncbi:DUF2007 domain-containing protein [Psychroflexus gondwanensis]|jgi:hypothetical protein|uniref:DUF2007 domain-containing protein n=1 Tax=Psychroflexus gondwanensis TaxID=251 RepID=UPI0011BD80D4|nr:DUF2007 domain-containing protein [Psychroflexus gondwanensis]TXE17029.1 DUF2007 domain-containing protein [Psychroflexus gondwanensis]